MTSGLRQRKKERTAETIAEVATGMMLDRGFDAVSIAEIAAAAEVSKMTVTNYFPAKEDLILGQIEDHVEEAATVVRGRAEGTPPLLALRRNLAGRLAAGDPATGLSDDPAVLAFRRLILETPKLKLRLLEQQRRAETALAAAFAEALGVSAEADPAPRLAAASVIASQVVLGERNLARVLAGSKASRLRRRALAEADWAFDRLEEAFGDQFEA